MEKPDYNSQTPFFPAQAAAGRLEARFRAGCLIVAGSVGYTGAPSLASRAAVRGGGGARISRRAGGDLRPSRAVKNDEAMPFPLKCGPDGLISPEALPELEERMAKCDVLAVGPRPRPERRDRGARERPAEGFARPDGAGRGRGSGPSPAAPEALSEGRMQRGADAAHGRIRAARGAAFSAPREEAAVSFARSHGCRRGAQGAGDGLRLPGRRDWSVNTTGNPGMARGGQRRRAHRAYGRAALLSAVQHAI